MQALFLPGGFHHPSNCWEEKKEGCKQSKKAILENNFLKKLIDKSISRDTLLNLLLINQDELVKAVKVHHSLGCSNHKMAI